MPDFREELDAALNEVRDLIIEKNKSYGDSALNPIRFFAKSDAAEQLKVRLDDKLSRLARGHEFRKEDTHLDFLGYMILLRILERRELRAKKPKKAAEPKPVTKKRASRKGLS